MESASLEEENQHCGVEYPSFGSHAIFTRYFDNPKIAVARVAQCNPKRCKLWSEGSKKLWAFNRS